MIQSDLRLGTPGNHRAQSLARTNIHVPQMSQYRSVKVPVVVLEQQHMWQSTWNVIRFQCRLLDEKFMNKLFVISISPFATYSVELAHFLQAILRRYSFSKLTFTKIETPTSLRNVLGEILCWKEWSPFLWMQVLTWPLSFHSVSLR